MNEVHQIQIRWEFSTAGSFIFLRYIYPYGTALLSPYFWALAFILMQLNIQPLAVPTFLNFSDLNQAMYLCTSASADFILYLTV